MTSQICNLERKKPQYYQVGLHHLYREGKVLFHIFSVVADTLFMRLRFDTDTLYWVLEETEDGV